MAANTCCAMQALLGISGDIPCTRLIVGAAAARGCRLLRGRLLGGRLLRGRRALLWVHLLGCAILNELLHLETPIAHFQLLNFPLGSALVTLMKLYSWQEAAPRLRCRLSSALPAFR